MMKNFQLFQNLLSNPTFYHSQKDFLFLREIAFLITEEKVLNWQSTVIKDNSNTLQRIDGKLDKLVEKIVMTDEKTNTL